MNDLGHAYDDKVFDLTPILQTGTESHHPREMLADQTLTLAEKRSILASWASDAAAVTSCPALRSVPGHRQPVSIVDILEALSALDGGPESPGGKPARRYSTSRVPAAA